MSSASSRLPRNWAASIVAGRTYRRTSTANASLPTRPVASTRHPSERASTAPGGNARSTTSWVPVGYSFAFSRVKGTLVPAQVSDPFKVSGDRLFFAVKDALAWHELSATAWVHRTAVLSSTTSLEEP